MLIVGIGAVVANVRGRLNSQSTDPVTKRLDDTSIFQYPMAITTVRNAHPAPAIPST
jgi:hypothetical protein